MAEVFQAKAWLAELTWRKFKSRKQESDASAIPCGRFPMVRWRCCASWTWHHHALRGAPVRMLKKPILDLFPQSSASPTRAKCSVSRCIFGPAVPGWHTRLLFQQRLSWNFSSMRDSAGNRNVASCQPPILWEALK
ncbi:MAG: hypothetical protein H6993_02790 [Pseudomonadales bacterium]|nr:hypothetical protein [Pseudomonadales bacterium]MCP5182857.1 hypothetical protein [Pseudomonadales bacterium]